MPQSLPQPKFILFDGVDGAGKTTTAKAVARALGAVYYKGPPEPFAHFRSFVQIQDDPFASYAFYMAANSEASREIEALLRFGKSVVGDRYYPSTFEYHAAKDPRIADLFDTSDLLQPDIYFLLTVDEETRTERLEKRKIKTGYDKPLENDAAYLNRIQESLCANNSIPLRPITIDTGIHNRRQVRACVLAHIAKELDLV